ncbi:MAG: cardiolipin synthase [Bacteroides sp.]|nr:cardiolipin synthase [Prevotella sp.]MCM1407152.1 cardiolipin synthase [Treponema brennaborense]MCM1470304.1 cardiolipin synthase [Bacteroides sp.]
MSNIITNLFTIISVLNTVFICFILFFERKSSSRRFAWLLTLYFVPGIGALLYILLSGHFFTKNRKMATAQKIVSDTILPIVNEQKEFFQENISSIPNETIKKYIHLINMNLAGNNSLMTFADSFSIYCWGQDMFEAMIRDMENAEHSIHIQTFIFRKDKTGTKIRDLLCRKARSGVAVKVLYDDVGCISTPLSFFSPLRKAGGEILPFFSIRRGSPFSLNFRNHRKLTIIDGKIGYMGGVNIGDEYANCSEKKHAVLWRDTHIRFTGSTVLSMQSVFLMDFYSMASGNKMIKTIEEANKYFPLSDFAHLNQTISTDYTKQIMANSFQRKAIPVQILATSPNALHKSEIRDTLIRMIMSARKTVYIQTPYFTPDETFFSILRIATGCKLDVRIMVPGKWDKWYVKAAAMGYIKDLMEEGIRFFSYNGFIHSKTIVVDGAIAAIGSANIDTRSFDLLFEVTAILFDKDIAATCESVFLEDMNNSRELTPKDFGRRFSPRKAWWGFFRLFSSLM